MGEADIPTSNSLVYEGEMERFTPDRHDKLYARALDILDGRANGHALPILRMLAARGFAPAINVLGDYLSREQEIKILRKAARRGDKESAYNLAVVHRNQGDLLGYRLALARAAKEDEDATAELRQFKTRFPEALMRRFRRLSPDWD